MSPIVDRLAMEFEDHVQFRSVDASVGEGEKAFRRYQMLGHPSYLILTPDGEVLWRSLGPQSRSTLVGKIGEAIDSVQGSP